jgi:hypothetical protein
VHERRGGDPVIHYHGLPITPLSALAQLAGCCFCVSYAAPDQVARAHEIGQSVMLDNGAFSFWKTGRATDWKGYYAWVTRWLETPTTWAVIPDVIEGDEEDNDRLVRDWRLRFYDHPHQSAPVWHMHESIYRLQRLADEWPRVCVGSSAQYATVGSASWHRRMEQAMNAICGNGPVPVWLHMLRGMALSGSEYPFASVDSTDVARNHNRPQNTPVGMARRWDAIQNPGRWTYRQQLTLGDAA